MFNSVPLVLCGSFNNRLETESDKVIQLVDNEEQASVENFYVFPYPSRGQGDLSEQIDLYSKAIIELISVVNTLDKEQSLLITSPHGIVRAPSVGIILRSALYDNDSDLAVTSQVAQRPQCQPSLTIISVGDYILGANYELYQATQEYLSTGVAVSSNGESFHYDPTGGFQKANE